MFATLTRSAGLLLFIAFVCETLWRRLKHREKIPKSSAFLLLIPCGLLLFIALLSEKVGEPFALYKYQSYWNRSFTFPLYTFVKELGRVDYSFIRSASNMQLIVESALAFLMLGAGFAMIRRAPVAMWMFVLLGVLFPLSSGISMGMLRFTAVLFPAFFIIAKWAENRSIERYIVASFSFMLAVLYLRFMNWYFTG